MTLRSRLVLFLLWLLAAPLAAQQREGDEAWVNGRHAEARAAYVRVLAQEPRAFRANLRLGLMLAWERRFDSALVHIARARAAEPNDVDAQVIEARVLAWSGQLGEAERHYRTVLVRTPASVDALVGLGYIYHWQGREGPAMRQARAALTIDSAHTGGIL